MNPSQTASTEATPPQSLTAEVRAVLASPKAALLPAQVRALITNLAITVDALGARVRALEENSHEK